MQVLGFTDGNAGAEAIFRALNATPFSRMNELPALLVLLSQKKRPIQKVAGEVLSESVIVRDSGIGNGGLIWICEHQTAVNRDFRILSRDL
jgi:hypothetical protein